ncbi:hypothetical protein [Streptomyces sp.]|uniref:hypothetical protein n=1 Tax=Streptomyces sp. TaxID=1931 RepID=UPI002F93AA1E
MAACAARAIFWPDVEACEAECIRPRGHGGAHEDDVLGEWTDDELPTTYPDE